MTTIGIIGGVGPESTIEYYRLMIAGYRDRKPDGSYPSIIINSIDVNRLLNFMARNELEKVIEYLGEEIQKLDRAGCHFGLIAANTPHIVFNEVQNQSPIPLISIVEATCLESKAKGFKKLALFGTRYTMQGGFYSSVFKREGIQIVLPDEDEQAFIHNKYIRELLVGIFLPETREKLLAIAESLKQRESIEGIILGGTELPLILQDAAEGGVSFLDTTRIHVNAAVERLLSMPRANLVDS